MKKQAAVKEISNPISMNTPETLRYFYHPDHIGSTSWVTDSAKNGILLLRRTLLQLGYKHLAEC